MNHMEKIVIALNYVCDGVFSRVRLALFPLWVLSECMNSFFFIFNILVNEFKKSRFGACGSGVRIYGKFKVKSPEKLNIGSNVHINNNAYLRADGGLSIGDNTHISRNLVIYTVNHDYLGGALPYDHGKLLKPVVIGRNVWIGTNVVIAPGVTVGDGAIIGMGAVVARDVRALEIIGSAPQRKIGQRDRRHYDELNEAGRFSGMGGYPLNKD